MEGSEFRHNLAYSGLQGRWNLAFLSADDMELAEDSLKELSFFVGDEVWGGSDIHPGIVLSAEGIPFEDRGYSSYEDIYEEGMREEYYPSYADDD